MSMNKIVDNQNDVLDFITSFDLGIKRQAAEELLKDSMIPKMYIGENKSFKTNIENDKYDRPILTFNLKQRGPASLSNTEFFIPPHQHGLLDAKILENGKTRYIQRKDNQIKITIRTKTQTEQLFLIGFLERVIEFQKQSFTSTKTQYVVTEVAEKIEHDYYIFHFFINIRTTIFVTEEDGQILEHITISNIVPLCKFFNLTNHTCMCVDVSEETKAIASDIKCSQKDFCIKYIPKINIRTKA